MAVVYSQNGIITRLKNSPFNADGIVNIVPIDKMVVVDSKGYIGYDLTNYFQYRGNTYYYNYAIISTEDDFSNSGLGQVTIYTPGNCNIGGRVYRTVIIGGREYLAENLDYKFPGLAVGQSGYSKDEPRGNYYNNDEATYGENGNKYGLLYNLKAVQYLDSNKSEFIPGWHIISYNEWLDLWSAVGGQSIAGTKLKSTTGWTDAGNGTDDFGFSAVPASYYSEGGSQRIGDETRFWSFASGDTSHMAFAWFFTYDKANAQYRYDSNSYDNCYKLSYSIRLISDYQ
jgi:uncharacterized protein (TIGR02145 family)